MTKTDTGRVVGVDVGGTFTDLIELDTTNGNVRFAKVPSTLDNQAFGVLNALSSAGCKLDGLDLIIHGTTTTTNAVLERKLSKTGLITTQGFRDILELGRRTRPNPYGMKGTFTPIIPRNLRFEVAERMDASGSVLIPLDEAAVVAAGKKLRAVGCESIVVHFLHAYANPAHELLAAELLADLFPDHITMGHALLSENREYERGVTAAVNASVQPILSRYIRAMREQLSSGGYTGDVLVMNGNGGMVSAARVAEEAAKTVMSGPASGVMAASLIGEKSGNPNLITYDMGGTSTDVSLIRDARPSVSNEIELEYAMPIHVPMVDVRTVGAGGGSIARVNAAGLLEVGPESAGATPGPICYGRGGVEPTISDANFLLGRLDPAKLAKDGGPSREEVAQIVSAKIAEPLDTTVEEAALAILRLSNVKMAGAIRMVSVSLGADPRDFALFAFGGAGPLHATALARELGIPRVLVPARPGITNAIGCATADLRHDFVRTINRPTSDLEPEELHQLFREQTNTGTKMIEDEKLELVRIEAVHSLDMQFLGQTHLIKVEIPDPSVTATDVTAAFEQAYRQRFHVELPEIRSAVVNVNTSVIGVRPEIDLSTLIPKNSQRKEVSQAQIGNRPVTFDEGVFNVPVYWRDYLPGDARISGPALIEQMDTTVLIEPDCHCFIDALGNILIEFSNGD